jgi:hypothetical protein
MILFAVAGLALAYAKSYTMSLYQPAMVGNTQLKAGDYQVELVDQKAVITRGKLRAEAPVKVETAGNKFDSTNVSLSSGSGTPRIREIDLGGTTTKLMFSE